MAYGLGSHSEMGVDPPTTAAGGGRGARRRAPGVRSVTGPIPHGAVVCRGPGPPSPTLLHSALSGRGGGRSEHF